MTSQEMLDHTDRLQKEADQIALRAKEHLRILRERVKANRPFMEKAQRQFGLRAPLWENLKP